MKQRGHKERDEGSMQPTEKCVPEPLSAALDQLPDDEHQALLQIWNQASGLPAREPSEERLAELGRDLWAQLEPQLRVAHPTARVYYLHSPRLWGAIAATFLLLVFAGLLYARWPDTITAPHGQRLTVNLPDGSLVDLNSGASITFAPRIFGWMSRSARLEGEAFFDVESQDSPFRIRTFNAEISVLGTSFNVRAWPDEPLASTSVALFDGKVRLANASKRTLSVEMNPGQMSRLSRLSERPSVPEVTDLQQTTAWRTGRFVFTDQPLGMILKEMERRFDVDIHLASRQILQDRLTLSYEEPDNPEVILQDIASSYSRYAYRQIPGGYELFLAPLP